MLKLKLQDGQYGRLVLSLFGGDTGNGSVEGEDLPSRLAKSLDKSPHYVSQYGVAGALERLQYTFTDTPEGSKHAYYYGVLRVSVLFQDSLDLRDTVAVAKLAEKLDTIAQDMGSASEPESLDAACRAFGKLTGVKLVEREGLGYEIGSYDYHNMIRRVFSK